MPELPDVTGTDAIKAFNKLGFVVDRIRGSHHTLKKPGHVYILTVLVHGKRSLKRGTLRSLIRDAGVTVAEFCDACG